MKPLFITGTQRDVGKTTLSVGLLRAFQKRGLRVAYTKPLGQRIHTIEGHELHDDALVVSKIIGQEKTEQADMVMSLTRGRVEKEIFDMKSSQLTEKVKKLCGRLAEEYDAVIVEGMGHVAMGSCLGLSCADTARVVGAKALLVSPGGIGSTIDEIALCSTFIISRGVEFLGAIVNKVWEEKYDRIDAATRKGLANIGLTSFGTIPFNKFMAYPTMRQVQELMGGELVTGESQLDNVVKNTIVAAMEAEHMIHYLRESTLMITPGDRIDNVLAALGTNQSGDICLPKLSGLLLTGGFRPDEACMKLIKESNLPVILIKGDTYAAASRFRQKTFKIEPSDEEKIATAVELVAKYVDVDAILKGLAD